jgi:hypothetical protein
MNRVMFKHYVSQRAFPDNAHIILKALFYDALGDWEAAHNIAQSKEGTPMYDHLHAYLHRKEGDTYNAKYWYRRAGITVPICSLTEEWQSIVDLYLEN